MNIRFSQRRKILSAAGALVAAATLLAACSASPDGGSGSGGTSFTVAGSDPANLTPGNTWAWNEEMLLFTPPMVVGEEGMPVPAAAESVTSEDQKVWTFKLRDGWTFHNGDPVTAQSYVDSWNATALGKNGWLQNYNFVNIEGYADLNPAEGEPTATELSGLDIVSDTEFTVTLIEPSGLFPYAVTSFAFAPMPKAAFEDPEAYDKAPIGNGPYSIVGSYSPNEPITLKRFEDYKGEAAKSDEIVFAPYQSMDTAYNDLLAGNVDVVYPVPTDRLADVEKRLDGRIAVAKIPSLSYFGFPTWDDRFDDVRVREAFSMAIDREALTSTILKGSGVPAKSLAESSTFGGLDDTCAACGFDPKGAKALLAEAGGWSGPLTLWAYQYTNNDQILQAVANQLRSNLGIEDITFQIDPYAKFTENVGAQEVDGPFLAGWGAYYPHIEAMLDPFGSPTGAANESGFASDEFNALMNTGRALPLEEGIPYFQEAESLFWKDMTIAPLYFGKYTAAWSEKITSVPVGFAGLESLAAVEVTE